MQVESGIRVPESRDEEDGAMSDRGGTTYTRRPLLYIHYVNFKVGPWAGVAKSPPSSTHFPVITLVWIRSSLVCLFICSFSFFTSYSSFSFLLFFPRSCVCVTLSSCDRVSLCLYVCCLCPCLTASNKDRLNYHVHISCV